METTSSSKKVKNVKFETKYGTKSLVFVPVLDDDDPEKLLCDSHCPYGPDICRLLKDPKNPDDKNFSFMDFCGALGSEEGGDVSFGQCVPMEGTLEANLTDFPEIYQVLCERNPLVSVNKVIDSVCQDSCDMYCPDHSMCRPDNQACFLVDLLKTPTDLLAEAKKNRAAEQQSDEK